MGYHFHLARFLVRKPSENKSQSPWSCGKGLHPFFLLIVAAILFIAFNSGADSKRTIKTVPTPETKAKVGKGKTIRAKDGRIFPRAIIKEVVPGGLFIEFFEKGVRTQLTLNYWNLPDDLKAEYGVSIRKAKQVEAFENAPPIDRSFPKPFFLTDRNGRIIKTYPPPTPSPVATTTVSLPIQPSVSEAKLGIIENILSSYRESHVYLGNDVFDCDDMACDVWNMLFAKGIRAQIVVGNVERPISSPAEANHAWVMAELQNDSWIALECTGGFVVNKADKPLYYTGFPFDNPKALKSVLRR